MESPASNVNNRIVFPVPAAAGQRLLRQAEFLSLRELLRHLAGDDLHPPALRLRLARLLLSQRLRHMALSADGVASNADAANARAAASAADKPPVAQ